MLEHLDSIDWRRLHHAYGVATDVPGIIRDLASSDQDVAEPALYEISSTIYHQGTVYEATAFAVPFLIELVASQDTYNRSKILGLLYYIRRGRPPKRSHKDMVTGKQPVERELQSVVAASEAVDAGYYCYVHLSQENDDIIRISAMRLMATVKGRMVETIGRLLETVRSDDSQRGRAAALSALIAIEQSPDISLSELQFSTLKSIVDNDDPPYVRLAAAGALAHWAGTATPPIVIQLLCEGVLNPSHFDIGVESFWIAGVLKETGTTGIVLATKILLDGVSNAPVDQIEAILHSILDMHFVGSQPTPLAEQDLKREQIDILRNVLTIDRVWSASAGSARLEQPVAAADTGQYVFRIFGLPSRRRELERFVQQAAGGN
jgi:hypothetical protein